MKTFIIIIVVLIIIVIKKRNKFESLRHSVRQALSDISSHEEQLTRSIEAALNNEAIANLNEVKAIKEATSTEQLTQLRFLAERYPHLRTMDSYQINVEKSFSLLAEINAAKKILNGNITEYNTTITAFPNNLIANVFGYKEEKLVDEENMEQNRSVERHAIDYDKFK